MSNEKSVVKITDTQVVVGLIKIISTSIINLETCEFKRISATHDPI